MRTTAVTAEFTLNSIIAGSVDVIGESRAISLSGGTFSDSFSGYGVHLYRGAVP
ncbi:MAG TPA: hypothetical protein PK926_16695 [Spirochaetota bacterium]|nr:hypothetical protein [Spirochaetota bacterium]HPI89364.1 hypothetical protein [Spirochaetota bacterium]HPR48291.1 hypothetical protein [Spirochaetota bacterium]